MPPRLPPSATTAAAAAVAACAAHSSGAFLSARGLHSSHSTTSGGIARLTHHHSRRPLPSRRLLPLAITWLSCSLFSSTARTGGAAERGSSTSLETSNGACLLPSSVAEGEGANVMEAAIRKLVPPLSHGARKGQMGRIGVLGGSADFTGAPYYAGMASLKVGGDLCYVLTAEEASGPIKTYSPELMVTPVYNSKELLLGGEEKEEERAIAAMVAKVSALFPKLHVLVIGPGLGKEARVMEATKRIIVEARRQAVPLVIDADGLWLVAHQPEVVKDFPAGCPVVLTPNMIEFARLQAGVAGKEVATAKPSDPPPQPKDVMALAKALGGKVTVCLKGPEDIIADGERFLVVKEPGALRRSGGLGDILAGTIGVAVHWAQMALPITDTEPSLEAGEVVVSETGVAMAPRDRALWACAAASVIARRAGRRAFAQHRRSMTAPDAIAHLGEVLEELAPTEMDL